MHGFVGATGLFYWIFYWHVEIFVVVKDFKALDPGYLMPTLLFYVTSLVTDAHKVFLFFAQRLLQVGSQFAAWCAIYTADMKNFFIMTTG